MKDIHWALPLLSSRSACLRYLVLTRLLDRGEEDPEVAELALIREKETVVTQTLALQRPDGSWGVAETPWMLLRLHQLGLDKSHPAVSRGASFLFDRQQTDGSWPLPAGPATEPADETEPTGYDMVPLQTALPLIGLAASGYATDPRSERAYSWLLDQRLEDGAWPTGLAGGTLGRVAGYRRLAHSRWGCRSNTTGALIALAYHPDRSKGPEAMRALNLLLGRETRERQQLGFEVARALGFEPLRGFFTRFARFDPALLLALAGQVGATRADQRVADLVKWVLSIQGSRGLWDYLPRPAATRWVTFHILLSLRALEANEDDRVASTLPSNADPRTPFQAYPRDPKRH